jgi:hypothetical protein
VNVLWWHEEEKLCKMNVGSSAGSCCCINFSLKRKLTQFFQPRALMDLIQRPSFSHIKSCIVFNDKPFNGICYFWDSGKMPLMSLQVLGVADV